MDRSTSPEDSSSAGASAQRAEAQRPSRGSVGRASCRQSVSRNSVNYGQEALKLNGAAETIFFVDADALKDQVYANIDQKEYDVADFYHESGWAQRIARHSMFCNLTLGIITFNAFWIGFEVQFNSSPALSAAPWYFQVGEYFFCVFFTFELCTRFLAFKHKRDCCRDFWFCFDSFLVAFMLADTFLFPALFTPPASEDGEEAGSGGGQGLSQLSMLRLLRLLRLTRMVRLMRSVPELVTLLRSMRLAARSVVSTLVLLFIVVYIFGVIFRSQFKPSGHPFLEERFGHLQDTMWNLLLRGTFLDGPRLVGQALIDVESPLIFVFIFFMWVSSLMVLNMLVGLLCDVVEVVAAVEKEKVVVSYVRSRLMGVLEALDEDGNGTISKDEFEQLLTIPEAVAALEDLGVDVQNLLSLSDHVFEAESDTMPEEQVARPNPDSYIMDDNSSEFGDLPQPEGEEVALTFADFLETVIKLRSSQKTSVANLVELRKLFMKGQKKATMRLDELEIQQQRTMLELQSLSSSLERVSSREKVAALVHWRADAFRQARRESMGPREVDRPDRSELGAQVPRSAPPEDDFR